MTTISLTLVLALAAGAESPPLVPPPPPGAPPAAQAPAPPATPQLDWAALATVKKMCQRLQAARTFSFRARTSIELPIGEGQLATFVNQATMAVRRPDGVATHRTGDLPDFSAVYDGKAFTVASKATGLWGTAPAPATIDGAVAFAAEQAGISFPFDELLVADPCAAITRDLKLAVRVGAATVEGKTLEHVLLASPGLQLEYWIGQADALPARGLIIYTDHPLRPHFAVELTGWNVDGKLPAGTFTLPKPNAARQVELREAASAFR